MEILSLLAAVVTAALMKTAVSALNLEEARQNPEQYIFYDPRPYSKAREFGFSFLLVYGVLILFVVSLALGAKLNGATRRRRAITMKEVRT